jgi:hypothetical protein
MPIFFPWSLMTDPADGEWLGMVSSAIPRLQASDPDDGRDRRAAI